MGALWETLGFALRSYSTQTLDSTGPYIPAQILIVLAPLWLNAFIYMVLGRMIHFFLPDKRCFGISARRLTLIFVILDVFAFLIQGASSSMLSSDDPKLINIGKNICMILPFPGIYCIMISI